MEEKIEVKKEENNEEDLDKRIRKEVNEEEEQIEKLSNLYKTILEDLGEDVNREGLVKTPHRVAKALLYFVHGEKLKPGKINRKKMLKIK
jgi:GTP cyclohydrolase IA